MAVKHKSPSTNGVYVAARCPCGHKGCTSANLLPATYGQGIMSKDEAEFLAHVANAYGPLVEMVHELIEAMPPHVSVGHASDRQAAINARALLIKIGEAL